LNEMRWGYSTGTCAAAASKAALVRLLSDNGLNQVSILLPGGTRAEIPVARSWKCPGGAAAEVVKDGGDDPDVTNGLVVAALVRLLDSPEVVIEGGKGVGKVTKPGLAVSVGKPAINPVPLEMIRNAVREVLPPGKGLYITISVPEGARAARKTMNPRLGIVGGISILGTSGLVRPMSQEAYLDSLIPQIDQAIALGHRIIVLTPGGMGARLAQQNGLPAEAVVQTSNFIGPMLEASANRGVKGILMFGHIGKIIKVAGGIFNTHSKVADARREIMAAHAAQSGGSIELINRIMSLNTMDESIPLLREYELEQVYRSIVLAVSTRCRQLVGEEITVGTVMYALDGTILARDENAVCLGRELAWNIP